MFLVANRTQKQTNSPVGAFGNFHTYLGKRHIPQSSNLADYLIQRSRVGGFVTTATFSLLQFHLQGDPSCVTPYFDPRFNPMWRSGISNGLAIPYARCIHVRTALTASATSLSEQSFSTAWASLVEACSLRSRSVLVDWQALVQHLVPRYPMYPFVYSGRALNIRIRGEPNNTGWAIPFFIGITFAGLLDSLVNNHTAGLFGVDLSCSRWTELVGLGRSPRSHRSVLPSRPTRHSSVTLGTYIWRPPSITFPLRSSNIVGATRRTSLTCIGGLDPASGAL